MKDNDQKKSLSLKNTSSVSKKSTKSVSSSPGITIQVKRKKIINQLLAIIKDSFENIVYFLFSFGANLKKINIEENTINIKKLRMKRPLDGSLAKV